MKYEDVRVSDYEIGITKIIGKKIKEIRGYLTSEFDDLTFKMTKVEFEDGTFLGCEGEHDMPYLVDWDDQPNFDEETLEEIDKSDPNNEEAERLEGDDE